MRDSRRQVSLRRWIGGLAVAIARRHLSRTSHLSEVAGGHGGRLFSQVGATLGG